MMMDEERIGLLADYLAADESRARDLLQIPAAEAVAKMNVAGFDFTIDDFSHLISILEELAVAENREAELTENTLESISGGSISTAIHSKLLILAWKHGYWISTYKTR